MAHVISALVADLMTEEPLFGIAVSDDDFRLVPVPPQTDADLGPMINNFQNRFAEVPADAQARMESAIYNSIFALENYTDEPDGDLQTAVETLTTQINRASEES